VNQSRWLAETGRRLIFWAPNFERRARCLSLPGKLLARHAEDPLIPGRRNLNAPDIDDDVVNRLHR
jgi:hypothetical protein